jgi:hypothetical protein
MAPESPVITSGKALDMRLLLLLLLLLLEAASLVPLAIGVGIIRVSELNGAPIDSQALYHN